MNNKFDEIIRNKLQENEYGIPESYNKKFYDTIAKLEDIPVVENKKLHTGINYCRSNVARLLTNNMARVAILLVVLIAGSVSAYAAVNMYQQRMEAIPDKATEKYNDNVQQNNYISADVFSRQLSEPEKDLMISLRYQYEEKGLFPQNEIKQLENNAEVVEGELCFVSEEGKYYLPERTLSEEEMLEIIDLQEKIEYSVRQKNKDRKSQESDNAGINMAADIQKQSEEVVAALFALDENELESISFQKNDDYMEYIIRCNDTLYYVDYSEDNIPYRVRCEKDNVLAHDVDAKHGKVNIKSISKKLKKQVETFANKSIDAGEAYSMVNENGEPAYGTVSIFYRMSDGSGCVVAYSMAYKELYNIYTINDSGVFEGMIKEKEEKAKKMGYDYKMLK